jgi:hypothetical protein
MDWSSNQQGSKHGKMQDDTRLKHSQASTGMAASKTSSEATTSIDAIHWTWPRHNTHRPKRDESKQNTAHRIKQG